VALALRYLFLDESGNLDFTSKGSKYFTLTSVSVNSCQVGNDLLELRRELAWTEHELFDQFHATEDQQAVRNLVFESIRNHDFRVDVTLLEKSKASKHLSTDPNRFYRLGVNAHLRFVIPQIATQDDDLLVVCASLGTRKQRTAHLAHLHYVIREVTPVGCRIRGALWSSASEPCLQVADYCCWAIHRKWERQDIRSYDLIADRIETEFDLFDGEGEILGE
jgi:hypothetical protein